MQKLITTVSLLVNLAVLHFISGTALAQTPLSEFLNHDFSNEKIEIPAQFSGEDEVTLMVDSRIEYLSTKNGAEQYYLFHDKKWINSDDAIERNNRVYLPFGKTERIVKLKLRVLLQNGNEIILNEKDIKEEINTETKVRYNYFAINGLEKGAIIEKFYIIIEDPKLNGTKVRFQSTSPTLHQRFEIIAPAHLRFKYKSYNGLPQAIEQDSTYQGKNSIIVIDSMVVGINENEEYSNWKDQTKAFRFKLTSNSATNKKNMFNYKDFTVSAYERLYPELNKSDTKAVQSFLKTIPKSDNTKDQIWNIEHKIKKTIAVNNYFEGNKTLADILNNKQATPVELTQLYIALFHAMNITVHTVFTSNRFKDRFDPDFETTALLDDILLYFPDIKQYLQPDNITSRTPLFDYQLAATHGYFIKEKEFGGTKMGIGEVAFIDIPSTKITTDTMLITVDFRQSIDNPTVTSHISFGGYTAFNLQPIKDFVPADRYQEILKDISKNYSISADKYDYLKDENAGVENLGKKPFILSMQFGGAQLFQKAGDKYLFKIGETIGKQTQLYQKTARSTPVEIQYPHHYHRTLKIFLPDGYTVTNLKDFNFDFKTTKDGRTTSKFVSGYSEKNGTLEVLNEESYEDVFYPLSDFEAYKAVINAAADFNKIVIVLAKK